ncbi:hypothetical protein A2686_01815 [Candidatus Woesebacteria bacterium RIFCSPHIGHO2_01_FULL_38_10]|uniref:Mannosyl-glycoprotein endo-beta-N-acetylglucosamidase-like domain-containing protein n=1 Tax=Candidatus Woesebacteria bacterium RIFCSPLOWO2_01_FULL_39_10b TaxID=1802517 RepID=A0A1F8B642_9BACT|nr:MAG: hypothetical protein A2686_01815 [Candidatus Woesebacteria bacterium RIFCSPHIGHO2_01_FULL_38_10]OGM59512.1 MAG: hypothetical protein A2892_02655 [Candidatus Woesebacteria bacterium RIFCSPLOWO2_01_FULL_39_10b]
MQLPSQQEDPLSFWKKILLIFIFFTITPIALFSSIISLIALTNVSFQEQTPPSNLFENPKPGVQVFASLPSEQSSISGKVLGVDARSELIKNYLDIYNSPLKPYSDFIVKTSDKFDLDYRLITAIAMKESGLCKVIPEESYNCWGWGIHSNGTLKFSSFEQGIEEVSKGLKENYFDQGLRTVEEIMSKYIPHSPGGIWAENVSKFMKEMQ